MKQQPDSVISITNLRKKFGAIQALDDLCFQVNKGDVFGFLGPNGSGKSTTIRILTSLVKPDSGSVSLFGLDIQKSRTRILSAVGALVERPSFYEHLSAAKNLVLLLKYSGRDVIKQDIEDTLELVGLKGREDDKVRHYSEGMKQRLGIAQAIIHQPDLLILDEPFNNLDPQGVKDIRDIVGRLNKEKEITIVISSHKLDEIEKLANRMVLINKGKTVAEGPISELINKGSSRVKLVVDDAQKAIAVLNKSSIQFDHPELAEGAILLSCNRSQVPRINDLLVKNNISVYSLSQDQSLESFFLSFMQST